MSLLMMLVKNAKILKTGEEKIIQNVYLNIHYINLSHYTLTMGNSSCDVTIAKSAE